MNVLDLIAMASLSVLLIIFFALMVSSKLRHKKTISVVTQLLVDRVAMSEEIERLTFIVENNSDLQDGFTKFLSESREDAFAYILDVQEAIAFIKYAMDLGDDEQINEAYARLISFLPNESPDVVN